MSLQHVKKRPETLETKHRNAAMTNLVGNCGGIGSLDGARPHTHRRPREEALSDPVDERFS
jgi:hypothetical protein